jgi:hypothetical protein
VRSLTRCLNACLMPPGGAELGALDLHRRQRQTPHRGAVFVSPRVASCQGAGEGEGEGAGEGKGEGEGEGGERKKARRARRRGRGSRKRRGWRTQTGRAKAGHRCEMRGHGHTAPTPCAHVWAAASAHQWHINQRVQRVGWLPLSRAHQAAPHASVCLNVACMRLARARVP